MTTFRAGDRNWTIELDGMLLDEVADETGVDIVNVSSAGLLAIETDKRKLCAVLRSLCRAEYQDNGLSDRDFSKLLKGEVLDNALKAVVGSVQAFFPQSEWSEMQSRLQTLREIDQASDATEVLTKAQPLAQAFASLPAQLREQMVKEAGGESSDLQALEALASATGPENTPASPTTDSAENSELAHGIV